jgi:hypothetical protein
MSHYFPLKKLEVENPVNEYDQWQDHPLAGCPKYILEAARKAIRECGYKWDLDEDDVTAIADTIVMELREKGYING